MRLDNSLACDVAIHGTAVLFLHAFPLNRHMWQPQMEALQAHGVPALAMDYPGFGESPAASHELSIEDYAARALEALDEARVPQAVVVGLSMGGYVAFALARRAPQRIRALVLANTRHTADTPETRQRRTELIEAVQRQGSSDPVIEAHLEKFFTAATRSGRPALVEQAVQMMHSASPVGVVHALRAMARRPDASEVLRSMTQPVLVIASEQDPLTPPQTAEAIAQLAPHARLVRIPDAAHLSNLEQPDAFNAALLDFLGDLDFIIRS